MTSMLEPNAMTALTATLLAQFQQQDEAPYLSSLFLYCQAQQTSNHARICQCVCRDCHAQLLIIGPVDSANQVFFWSSNYVCSHHLDDQLAWTDMN